MAEEDAIDKIKQAIKTAEQFSDLYYRFWFSLLYSIIELKYRVWILVNPQEKPGF